MKRCPKDSLLNAFYLKPLQKFKDKSVWYSTVPLGHNKLNSIVKTMMSEADVEGFYTNHSLRATAVSRLFQLTIRLRARVFYEQIVNEAQPS